MFLFVGNVDGNGGSNDTDVDDKPNLGVVRDVVKQKYNKLFITCVQLDFNET